MVAEGDRHICFVFDSDEAFSSAAAGFLRRGLHEDRLLYIADRARRADLLDDLIDLGDAELFADEGDLIVQTAAEAYYGGGEFDPAQQIERYRALVDTAMADGFKGLRVAADVSALVDNDDDRRTFMAYELAVDRFIASVPMWAMCAYNGPVLEAKAIDLACVHRHHDVASKRHEPGFCLWTAGVPQGAAVALEGEVDASNADRLAMALEASRQVMPLLADADEAFVVDASGLTFIDAEGTKALARFAEHVAPQWNVVVAEPPRSLCAVVETLGWDDRIRYVRSGERR